jgi:hypothetical protein
MATPNQSQLQSFIEQMNSTNANAQTAQPTNPNNGNPNTANNVPNPNVNVLPAQMDGRGNWWTPPVNSGIDLQALLGQLPRSNNTNIDNILGNLTRPPAGPGPVGPGGPTTPPVTPPTTPPTGVPPAAGGPIGTPVGPISGPIASDPLDWLNNYNNAQPNTNLTDSGLGRQGALDWLNLNYGQTGHIRPPDWLQQSGQLDTSNPDSMGSTIVDWFRNLGSRLGEELRGEWNEFVDDVTLQNGVWGLVSQVGRALGIPDDATDWLADIFNSDTPIPPAQLQQMAEDATSRMLNQSAPDYQATLDRINSRMEELATRRSVDLQQLYQNFYNAHPEATEQEWQNMMESIQWNNFWYGRPGGVDTGGVDRPRLGLPSDDFVSQMLNGINQDAVNALEWFQNMGGREVE